MNRFLPILKSKQLENQFINEEHNNSRSYFNFLCVLELINYIYSFVSIIKEGIINSRLIATHVGIILLYGTYFLFSKKKMSIGMYLIALTQCFFPLIRYANSAKTLSLTLTNDYIQGILNILQLILHIQSPSFFFKFFCIVAYGIQESMLNLDENSDTAQFAQIGIVLAFYLVKSYLEDRKQRINFLQSQRLHMWSQLIDKQIKMSFFIAKPNKQRRNMKSNAIYQNQIQMQFINKYARNKYAFSTSVQFNAFLERIIIQDEDEDEIDEAFRKRIASEKMSFNRLMSMSKGGNGIQQRRNLYQICQELIESSQKQDFQQTLSNISACLEYTGILLPQQSSTSSTNQKDFKLDQDIGSPLNRDIIQKSEDQQSSQFQQQMNKDENQNNKTISKAQVVQIKLYYYNLTEDYLIIQIEEEDYKLKLKKQRDEQKKALAFRDKLTFRMKLQVENIIQSVKLNFDQFKLISNYKTIFLDMYLLKQYQQNILNTLTDFNLHFPYQVQQVHLKILIHSMLNLFSDSPNPDKNLIPHEIFTFELKNDLISTSSNWLNLLLFNLILNGKTHGQKNSQIQVKVCQDELDDNIINIDIVNELQQNQEEQQIVYIEEMKQIENQEELFAFYFKRQKQLEEMLRQKEIKNNIKNKFNDSPNCKIYNSMNNNQIETLKYTLGIYVSRQSLKKIGPSGNIQYSRTKMNNKSFLVASFQIYKDIEDLYMKEKDNFIDNFGKNNNFRNLGDTQNNNYQQKNQTLFEGYDNLYSLNNCRNNDQDQNNSGEKKKLIDQQQTVKDFLYSKAMEVLKNQETDLNYNSQTEEMMTLQNYKNSILNNQLILQSEQILASQKLYTPIFENKKAQFLYQQNNNNNNNNMTTTKESQIQNSNIPQKSLFYRTSSLEDPTKKTDDIRDSDIMNGRISHEQINKNKLDVKNSILSDNEDNIQISNEICDPFKQNTHTIQDYQISFKKNPALTIPPSVEILDTTARQMRVSQRDKLIPKEQEFYPTTTDRNNKLEYFQNEDQFTISTPNILCLKNLNTHLGDYPLLQNNILEED